MNITITDPKTGKPQTFGVELENRTLQHTSHLLTLYGQRAGIRKLDEAVTGIRNCGFSNLVFTPLVFGRENINQYGIRAWRGCEDDPAPFVVRGRKLPTVKATPGKPSFWWRSTEYGASLTPGQTEALRQWFDHGLERALTEQLLESVKREAIAELVAYAKKEVENYRRQLAEIEAYEVKL